MALPGRVLFRHDMLPFKFFGIFKSMRQNGECCDVTIDFEDRTISAHRIILFAAFPRFRDKFGKQEVRINKQEMTSQEIEPSALESLIDFAYSCRLEITSDNVKDLLTAASYLKAEEVQRACADFILERTNAENAMETLEFAKNLGCSTLVESCQMFIREHFDHVSLTEGFLRAPFSSVRELISSDHLTTSGEDKVLEAAVNWIKRCPVERESYLPDLISLVRLTLLPPKYLKHITDTETLIDASLACRDLLDVAKNYHLLPQRRDEYSILVTRPRKRLRLDPEMNLTKGIGDAGICAVSKHMSLSVQYMDFGANEWRTLDTEPFEVGTGTVVSSSGTIYFVDAECIRSRTLQTSKWTTNARFTNDRKNTSAAILKNKLYICGGRDSRQYLKEVLCFDLEKNEYNAVPSMHEKRLLPGVLALDRYLYVFGGHNGLSTVQSVEKYDPDNHIWRLLSSMKSSRYGMGCCALGGKIYVCGGKSSSDNKVWNSAEVYDPLKNQWEDLSPMKVPRVHFSLVSSGRNIYAVGGCGEKLATFNSVEIYDPCTDEWTFGPNTDPAEKYVRAVSVGCLND